MTALSCYVYYRVAPGAEVAAEACVRGMLRALEVRTLIRGRLMASSDEPLLWMEVYEGIADAPAFEAALDAAESAAGIAAWLAPGERRHVERFRALPERGAGPS